MDWPLSQGNNICIKSHRCSLQIETYTYEENSCNAIQFTRATGLLPHITYCNIIWGNSNQSKLNSILILKKKALRICTHSNYLAHTNPIFHELKTLKLHGIHTYQTSIFMFKHTRNLLPLFHDVFTHNRDITPLAIVSVGCICGIVLLGLGLGLSF